MDTHYTPQHIIPETARASIARELGLYYAELAGTDDKPTPRFSLARVLESMATPHGLRDGYEREICGGAAMSAGESFDQHRVLVPLQALQRDMTVASAASAGYLVTTAVGEPIDVLRPWSVAASAGITILSNLRENLVLPRVTVTPTAGWLSTEATPAPDSQPTLGQTLLSPKTASVYLEFSRQWAKQAAAGELLLRQQLLGAVGQLIDEAFFAGTGASGAPLGLLGTAGIGTQPGGSIAHLGLLSMREAVLLAGGQEQNLRWVGTPGVQKLLGARERSTGGGRFLWDDVGILGRPASATKLAPAATLICGDFSQAYLAMWGSALRLEINPFAGFQAGVMAARVMLSIDFGFPTPSSFCVGTTIT